MKQLVILSTCAVIKCQEKFLILQRNKNDNFLPLVWEFPGGGVEKTETIEAALIREIKEETGIDISQRNLNFLGVSEEFTTQGKAERYLQLNYLIDVFQLPQVTLSSEHTAYDWATMNDTRLDCFLQNILNQIQ